MYFHLICLISQSMKKLAIFLCLIAGLSFVIFAQHPIAPPTRNNPPTPAAPSTQKKPSTNTKKPSTSQQKPSQGKKQQSTKPKQPSAPAAESPAPTPPPPPPVARYNGYETINNITVDWNNVTQTQKDAISECLRNMVFIDGGTLSRRAVRDGYHEFQEGYKVGVKGFYMNRYEVTQGLWRAVMGEKSPSLLNKKNGANCPVENVTYYDCIRFIQTLNNLTGLSFRLPSDDEWMYAALGGSKSRGYEFSGGNSIASIAWYSGNSDERPRDVGTKMPNEVGIYDMTGNVWEWTTEFVNLRRDWYSTNLERSGYICRGGSWFDYPQDMGIWVYDVNEPNHSNIDLGFRLVL